MQKAVPNLILPTPAQLEWADCEVGVIIHLDVQVFEPDYDFRKKRGYTPDPAVFNPSELDTDQWIRAAKSAGATYAVLVAKHCSGFSLWPTEAHDYSVKSSPWRGGKGDIVADFFASCKKFGLKPGLYCSAACNARFGVDNPGKVLSGDPEEQARYNRILETQLTELWSNYGELFYIWFDGGVLPPDEGGPTIIPLLKKLQPNAVVFQGPHDWPSLARAVGNERGEPPDPFWNTTGELTSEDGVTEREDMGGDPEGARWAPGESDIPNRCQRRAFQGGWFWRKGDDPFLYSLDHMVERYFTSVGGNTNWLVGMVIDDRGRVPDADERRFREIGERIKKIFSNRVATVSGKGGSLALPLPAGSAPNMLVLCEDIAQGERVRRFTVEGWIDGKWVKLWRGTCIGHKKIERFDPLRATQLRLTLDESVAEPQIREFSAWKIEDGLLSVPLDMTRRCRVSIQRGKGGVVRIGCSNPALSVRYTLDGTEPKPGSPVYEKPFALPNGGTVRAQAFINELSHSPTTLATFGVDRSSWRVVGTSLDSPFANDGRAGVSHLLDDDSRTYWHTYHQDKALSAPPHEVVLDMGRELKVEAFTLQPRNTGSCEGAPEECAFYLGPDGKEWTLAVEAKFDDMRENAGMRFVPMKQPMTGRYLRLVVTRAVDGGNYVVVAGVGVVVSKG